MMILDLQHLVPVFLIAILILAIVLLFGGTVRDRQVQRLRRIQRIYSGAPADPAALIEVEGDADFWQQIRNILHPIVRQLGRIPLATGDAKEKLVRQLKSAGFDNPNHLQIHNSAKILFACLFAVPGLWFPFLGKLLSAPAIDMTASAVMGALIGAMLPDFTLDWLIRRRRRQIANALPDALDLMCICTNAGYSLDMSIERVAREIKVVAPALSSELMATFNELRLLPDRQAALHNFAERTQLPSVRSLVVTLVQTQKFGTPLTVALKTLADSERKNRMIALEEQAAKLPAVITVPLMLFILPTVFIIVCTPAAVQVMKMWH